MENELTEQKTDYGFLEDETVEKGFADLNMKLLAGKHIHNDEYNSFSLLEEWFDPLYAFYSRLYKMELVRDVYSQSTYYYLDFFSGGKGKLSDPCLFLSC